MEAQTYELKFNLNGKEVAMLIDTRETLLDVIRDRALLTGAKKGCDEAACGACSVLLNGRAVCSCTMLAVEASGNSVVTIEGVSGEGKPSVIQEAFIGHDAFQCGFCTSGQIVAATSLLSLEKHPGYEEIREGMSGNVCRCGAYAKILDAVAEAARESE